MPATITEHAFTANPGAAEAHTTAYLAGGPVDGPLLIFVHGWPELGSTWRYQLECFAGLGFRVVAPDLRGYGNSTVYPEPQAYAQRHVVADMLALLDHLQAERAVWIGHDWGSPTVWNLATHHPERCVAVANLCVPYATLDWGLDTLISLVDRDLYPQQKYPAGQFEYFLYYAEQFQRACAVFDADVAATISALYRSGNPEHVTKPAPTSRARIDNGWFHGADSAPTLPIDPLVLDATQHARLTAAMTRTGFAPACSYYLNNEDNADYGRDTASRDITMPVLFIEASYDTTCQTATTPLADPMRQHCTDLRYVSIDAAHWVGEEKPTQVNAAIAGWLAGAVPSWWPVA